MQGERQLLVSQSLFSSSLLTWVLEKLNAVPLKQWDPA